MLALFALFGIIATFFLMIVPAVACSIIVNYLRGSVRIISIILLLSAPAPLFYNSYRCDATIQPGEGDIVDICGQPDALAFGGAIFDASIVITMAIGAAVIFLRGRRSRAPFE